jgi:RNA polymerase sigma factor (sigma-70 family)
MSKKDKLNINTNDSTKIIELTAQTAAEKVVLELQKKGLLKDSKQSAFQKTEILLYNYYNFKNAIEDKQEQIKNIRKSGTNKKSKSITSFSSGQSFEVKDEAEKAEEQIAKLEHSITVTRSFIRMIDNSLNKLQDDKYFEIIKLKYFEGKKREEMASAFDCDEKTVTRNKNRLINQLKIDLFSDESIIEMFK